MRAESIRRHLARRRLKNSDPTSSLGLEHGINIKTSAADSQDVLLDYPFLELLLAASQDPDTTLGAFVEGVRVGPGVQLPRLPALYKAKKNGASPNNLTHYCTWRKLRLESRRGDGTSLRSRLCRLRSLTYLRTTPDEDKFSNSWSKKQDHGVQVSSLLRLARTGRRSSGVLSRHGCYMMVRMEHVSIVVSDSVIRSALQLHRTSKEL